MLCIVGAYNFTFQENIVLVLQRKHSFLCSTNTFVFYVYIPLVLFGMYKVYILFYV